MKKIIFTLLTVLVLAGVSLIYAKTKSDNATQSVKKIEALIEKDEIKNGDIIFQTSLSSQSLAIQHATRSKYSHCGIIFKEGSKYFVFEAVQPVKATPLDKWVARGKDKHFVIKRLKNASDKLVPSTLQKMKMEGNRLRGKSYDLTFEWSDSKIYCSELIWKIYKRGANIEVGKLEKLGDFDLSDKAVKEKIKERWGRNIPMNETVISPSAIYNSNLLETVATN